MLYSLLYLCRYLWIIGRSPKILELVIWKHHPIPQQKQFGVSLCYWRQFQSRDPRFLFFFRVPKMQSQVRGSSYSTIATFEMESCNKLNNWSSTIFIHCMSFSFFNERYNFGNGIFPWKYRQEVKNRDWWLWVGESDIVTIAETTIPFYLASGGFAW